MLKNLLVLTVLWASIVHPAHAAKVKFDETVVNIPPPEGFVQMSDEGLRLAREQGAVLDFLKACFYPKPADGGAKVGLPTQSAAVFAVDSRATGGISAEDFAKLVASSNSKETKDILKAQLPDMAAPAIGAPPGSQDRRQLPVEILSPHVSSDRHLAISMRMTGKTIGPGGKPIENKRAYTLALVVVRGMVIRLMVQSESEGVERTQDVCRAWAEAVIAANPAEPGSASAFSIDAPVEAFDRFMADLPIDPIVAQARTIPWLGTLSPSALNAVLGVAALAILIFAFSMILKIFRRLRG